MRRSSRISHVTVYVEPDTGQSPGRTKRHDEHNPDVPDRGDSRTRALIDALDS